MQDDFNPIHHHNGDFSAAIYLKKVPEGMTEEWDEDFKDHYPAKGLIEFTFGDIESFRNDGLKFKTRLVSSLYFLHG